MKKIFVLALCFVGISFAQLPGSSFKSSAIPQTFTGSTLHTSARLIARTETFVPGDTVELGVVLEMKDQWHTYWINPGVAGAPTYVDWELPEGFSVTDFEWPTPKRFEDSGLVSFGYEDKVVLRLGLQTPAEAAVGSSVLIKGTVHWLECKDLCLKGRGEVSLRLVAGETTGPENEEMVQADQSYPREEEWVGSYKQTDDVFVLEIDAEAAKGPFVEFYPTQESAWVLEPQPEVHQNGDRVLVTLKMDPASPVKDPEPAGILLNESGQGFRFTFGTAEENVADNAISSTTEEERSVWYMLVLAFVAGMGMNLLPCIFPVLGLKISGFVEQAQGDPKSVRTHALIFAAGVILSLWILGAVVGVLGAAWGVQFQNPKVVIGMLLVLTFFTMNLFGIFEIGNKLTTVGGDLTQKSGYAGSFFQGILLTVIGTPCTGPILAGSIVWMLTQPLWIGFSAFTLMGIGMSLPYVVLAYSPKLIEKLPRPGTWMITFKKASAFMIVMFLWVLLYVLKGQISPDATIRVLGALLVVCFAAWVLGTWAAPGRKPRTQRIARVSTLLLLGASIWFAYTYHEPSTEVDAELQSRIESGDPIRWTDLSEDLAEDLLQEGVPLHYRPWSPELVEELRKEGKNVFVDFTADWCTICKLNKARALHRKEVMEAFQEKGVVTLRADWTGRDARIAKVLEAYNRQGVPVYMLFDTVEGTPAELLPEKLTPEIIFDALDNL